MPEVGRSVEEATREFTSKVSKGILPPDPARIAGAVLEIPPAVEHALPLPPLLEKVHSEITEQVVEKLPRLPLTSDFPIRKWKEYRVE
jgi:hypothetical protein